MNWKTILQPVEPEARAALPVQVEQTIELACSAEVLFDVFEDPASWPVWLGITVDWHDEPPFAAGCSRTIRSGPLRALERFTVYERNARMAFFFEKSTSGFFEAFAEDWIVTSTGPDTCTLTWRVGIQPRGVWSILGFGFRIAMNRLGRQGFPKLQEYVRRVPLS